MRPSAVFLALLSLVAVSTTASSEPVWFEGSGHYYDYVDGQTTWNDAVAAAELLEYAGLAGHLVTITSAAENDFISVTFASGEAQFFAWIGGYEPDDDGVWLWGAGPEYGIQFSLDGAPTPPYYYVNWGGVEPNDFNPGEDFAAINLGDTFAEVLPGQWIDSPNPNPSDPIHGMIVEYEEATGVPDDGAASSDLFLSSPVACPSPGSSSFASVRLELARTCSVSLCVYDVRGRETGHRVHMGGVGPGPAQLQLKCDDLVAGVYFVRVSARLAGSEMNCETETIKLVVLN